MDQTRMPRESGRIETFNYGRKRILLVEPDKDIGEYFLKWLKDKGFRTRLADDRHTGRAALLNEEFDILLIDIDSPLSAEDNPLWTDEMIRFCKTIHADESLAKLPVAVMTFKTDIRKIAVAIDSGVDSVLLKPFETANLLQRMRMLLKEVELKKNGKTLIDVMYLNYLMSLTVEIRRDDFFIFAPVVFNKVIGEKLTSILGEPVIQTILQRIAELDEGDEFMQAARFQNGKIVLSGVEKISRGVPVRQIAVYFKNYIFTILQLVQTLTSGVLIERGGDHAD
jgi:DNA-binding response OmpR family regulator